MLGFSTALAFVRFPGVLSPSHSLAKVLNPLRRSAACPWHAHFVTIVLGVSTFTLFTAAFGCTLMALSTLLVLVIRWRRFLRPELLLLASDVIGHCTGSLFTYPARRQLHPGCPVAAMV